MKLVVGLGNPGKKYEATRHNVGFDVLRELARKSGAGPVRSKFHGEVTDVPIGAFKVLLLCPHTYMNESGRSVQAAADFYKIKAADILVICDDFNLPLAKLRFRPKGSSGGQKGLGDIIRCVGTDQISRLRVGIGAAPENWKIADYVLSKFSGDDAEEIKLTIQKAATAVVDWIEHDTQFCMNRYNG